jgi:hypothetical protein
MPVIQPDSHRRAHARLRVGIAARIETLDGQLPVRLIDLSQKGAQLIMPRPDGIKRGVLTWLGFEAYGELVWQQGDHVGIEFDEAVPIAELLETRDRAPSVVREEALTIEADARDWVAGNSNQGVER